MPLIECPDCKKQISDLASSCIQCGRPMNPSKSSSLSQQPNSVEDEVLKIERARFKAQQQIKLEESLKPFFASFKLGQIILFYYDKFTSFLARQNTLVRMIILVSIGVFINILIDGAFPISSYEYLSGKRSFAPLISKAFIYISLIIVFFKIPNIPIEDELKTEKEETLGSLSAKTSSPSGGGMISKIIKRNFPKNERYSNKSFLIFFDDLAIRGFCLKCFLLNKNMNSCPNCKEDLVPIEKKDCFEIANFHFGSPFKSFEDFQRMKDNFEKTEKHILKFFRFLVFASILILILMNLFK